MTTQTFEEDDVNTLIFILTKYFYRIFGIFLRNNLKNIKILFGNYFLKKL